MTTHANARTEDVLDYDDAVARFDPVIGLEVHVELGTRTKMFCGCGTGVRRRAEHPGLPGLPRPARRAAGGERVGRRVRDPHRARAALRDPPWGRFARKNYFYPDMPKNFQTSQYDEPIATDGYLDVELDDGTTFRVADRARAHGGGHRQVAARRRLHRPHPRRRLLAGRLQPRRHPADRDRHQAADRARACGRPRSRAPTWRRCATCSGRSTSPTCGWSRARCAATSTSRCGPGPDPSAQESVPLGTRTETKNVNSLRSVERAVRYEITRQARAAERRSADRPGDAALAREHRRHHVRPREVRRRGLPLLPGARPGADRPGRRLGRAAARHAARAAGRAPPRGCSRTGASPTSRCATWSTPAATELVEATVADGRCAGRRPQVVDR